MKKYLFILFLIPTYTFINKCYTQCIYQDERNLLVLQDSINRIFNRCVYNYGNDSIKYHYEPENISISLYSFLLKASLILLFYLLIYL